MIRVQNLFSPLLFILILSACQTTDNDSPEIEAIFQQSDLLRGLNVDLGALERNIADIRIIAWDYINDRNLIVDTGADGYFLVTFSEPCQSLGSAINILFEARIPMLNPGNYAVAVSPRGAQNRCRIAGMYHLIESGLAGA